MNQLQTLCQKIQAQGYRLTQARQVILQTLLESGAHQTADELALLVNKRASNIGRMTVYRTLELLTELGVVRPIYQGTGAAHYVLLEEGHHHHMVCNACQKVIELEQCWLEGVAEELNGRFGFQIQGHLLEFYGTCADCQ